MNTLRSHAFLFRAALALACTLCSAVFASAATNAEQLKRELAALEDEFCAATRTMGILAAFKHYAAPDATMLAADPRQFRGAAAIEQVLGPDRPGVSVTWSAYHTDISEDGTLGYNYGRYEWTFPRADGTTAKSTGWFLTIWKRQPDGTWRFVLDTGVPDRPAPAQG